MNHLEMKHLRMMIAISETGNMTRAAERLFLSQSALSQQLKDIENKLAVELFFRTPKKMIPTSLGKKLLKTAFHVTETLGETELEIAKAASGDSGELKVGTQCLFCYKWLPGVMDQFHRKFPNMDFEIGYSSDLTKDLENQIYDLVITGSPPSHDGITYSPLFQDQMVCIMCNDSPFSTRSHMKLVDFQGVRLLSYSEKRKNSFYQNRLKPNGIEPDRFMTVNQPHAIIEMVISGFGMSVFPRWAVNSSLESQGLTALPITKKGLPLTWNIASLKKSTMPVYMSEFINLVKKANISGHGAAQTDLASGF